MGIADARAMYPSIEVVEADPEADRRLLEALADWCDRYTPLVALDGSRRPVPRHHRLRPSVRRRARRCSTTSLARFFHQGFDVRAGLASTPGAAWAAARFSPGGRILEPGRGGRASGAACRSPRCGSSRQPAPSLESVGLRTVGRGHGSAARAACPPLRHDAASPARPGARPDRGSDLAAPAGGGRFRSSGISPSRSSLIEDIERLVLHAGGDA